jgi:hypothetical protein
MPAVADISLAEVPGKVNYQGRLADNINGEPLAGTHDMTFRIYDAAEGGSMLWSEETSVEADSAGVFGVILGELVPIGPIFEGPRWLEMVVEGETLSPRRELVSVPFAFRAADAASLDGLSSSSFALMDHEHDAEYVNEGQQNSVTIDMLTQDVVASIDGVSNDGGDVDLVAGDNITITPDDSNDQITIAASGGGSGDITAVYADDGLRGGAFSGDAHLSVNTGTGLETVGDTVGLTPEYSSGSAYDTRFVNEGQAGSVTEGMVAPKIVSSVDGVTNDAGDIDLVGGANITIIPDDPGNQVTISADGIPDGYSLDARDGDPANVVYVDSQGEVGIGTTAAKAALDVRGEVKVGTSTDGHDVTFYGDQVSLQTTKLLWNSAKAGLRIGLDTDGTHWAPDSIGYYSLALGYDCKAVNNGSVAIGWRCTADGHHGFAMGSNVYTRGQNSLVFGRDLINLGSNSIVLGTGESELDPFGNIQGNSFLVAFDDELLLYAGGASKFVGIGNGNPWNFFNVEGYGTDFCGYDGYDEVVARFIQTEGGHSAIGIDAPANQDPIVYLSESMDAMWSIRNDASDANKFQLRYHGGVPFTRKAVTVDSTGNVGIGTTNPGSMKLYVNGDACSHTWTNCSDLRFKREVKGIENALAKIMGLRGVSFGWKTEEFPEKGFDTGNHYGVVAQEVEAVLPEVVRENLDGEKSVAYSEIIPVLIEAIKELETENDNLKQRLAAIEARLD